jgi:2,4-dienoyl-CoA reductase-like NADH-dependent reductase (Old Yellow Enzyme family)
MMNVASRIERLIRKGGIKASQIGREAMHDPGFVRELRNGRQLRPETEARLAAWLDSAEQALLGDGPCAQ